VARLKPDLVARTEDFSDRMLDVVEALERKRVYAAARPWAPTSVKRIKP
jgi:hypothetical protein